MLMPYIVQDVVTVSADRILDHATVDFVYASPSVR